MPHYTGQHRYVSSRSQLDTWLHPRLGRVCTAKTKCPHSACQGWELGQGPWQGGGNSDEVDKGLNKGRVGSSFGEGQRVRAEQLGTEATTGQSKPEEGGGPSWVQQACRRLEGESTDRAQGHSGRAGGARLEGP